jgi:hypothetical protein
VRGPDRGTEGRGAFGLEHLIERPRELRIAILDQEANIAQPPVDGEVPGLLGSAGL